jgi:hypothetical protein
MMRLSDTLQADEAAMLAAYRAMNHATREITLAFARTLAAPAARPRPTLVLVQSNLQQRGGAR